MLSLELDRPPDDKDDRYFARVLAHGPDPMLLDHGATLPEPAEPPLDVDEPIRVITPSSSKDCAGLTAMQELIPADPLRTACPSKATTTCSRCRRA